MVPVVMPDGRTVSGLLSGVVLFSQLKKGCTLTARFKKLIGTALVRSTYAGWCGGTAARAASYPLS